MLVIKLQGMKEKYTCVSARLATDVTKKELCKYLEKEETETCKIENVTAFSQTKVMLEGKDIGRQLFLDAYCVYGNIEDVLPVSLITGNLLIREDTDGCILTKEAAYKLFGSINANGLEIIMNHRTYVVRGVISSNVEAILYEAKYDTDTFDCLEFQISDENGEYYTRQFLAIYGLSEDYIIGENYLVNIAQNLSIFPFLIVMIYFIIFMEAKAKQYKVKKGIRIGFLVVNIVLIIILGKQIGYFPERWIPSKWSNFSHYTDILEDIKQQLKTLSFARPVAKEVALRTDLMKTAVLFVASILGLSYILRNLNDWASKGIDGYFQNRDMARRNVLEEKDEKRGEEIEESTNEIIEEGKKTIIEESIKEIVQERAEEIVQERTDDIV